MLTGGTYRSTHLQRLTNPQQKFGQCTPLSTALLARASRDRCRDLSQVFRSVVPCRAAGVAEVAKPEESEVFRTNDGVIEPVEDDEAEVACQPPAPSTPSEPLIVAFLPLQIDFLGESTTGNLRFVQRVRSEGIVNVLGLQQLDDIVTIPYRELKTSQQVLKSQTT